MMRRPPTSGAERRRAFVDDVIGESGLQTVPLRTKTFCGLNADLPPLNLCDPKQKHTVKSKKKTPA